MEIYSEHESASDMKLLDRLGSLAKENIKINTDMYSRFNVKRGLRNSDGTGVLVGLTEIGEVHAYIMDENEKVPLEGRLFYRGIDLYDIVKGFQDEDRFGFEECCYLLLFGKLPSEKGMTAFEELLGHNRALPEGFNTDMILTVPSRDIMNNLARSVLAMYFYDGNPDDTSVKNIIRQSIGLIARFPTMAVYSYQAMSHYHYNKSLIIHSPQVELSTAENILYMIRPDSSYSKSEAKLLDLLLALHAEHGGGNNSTFVTRVVSSSGTDTYSTIAAAIGALKGPKHGGANLKVMGMMEEIKRNVGDWADEDEVERYLEKILNKEAFDKSGLIYGIGHAVYTLSDPRAVILKNKAEELSIEKGMQNEYKLYSLVEKLAPKVFYEIKKGKKILCANVDFYSGFVYRMLDIPVELYTPLFAIARIAGWSAHRIEEITNCGKIIRPAYKSVAGRGEYVKMSDRQ